MNQDQWNIVLKKTEETKKRMEKNILKWDSYNDSRYDLAIVTNLKIIEISPGDETLQVFFTTKDTYENGKTYLTKCLTGYNQEDSTFDDVNETFFKRLKWET